MCANLDGALTSPLHVFKWKNELLK